MDESKQKWWVRWYIEGDDSRPVTFPTPVEWWCTGYSDTHSINCAIVHADDENGCVDVLRANGWPECDSLDSCAEVEADWRPIACRFPPRNADQSAEATP